MGNRATTRALLLTACAALFVAGCSHEAADWKSATLANTTEAYQSFLQQYPRGHEAAEAQTRIKQLSEERDWQNAIASNTRDAYEQFTTQHPDSKYGQEAKLRIENFAQADLGTASTANAAVSAPPGASSRTAAAPAPPSQAAAAPAQSKTAHLAAAKSKTASKAHSGASSRWVQLGAFGSKARAESRWRQLSARFSALKTLHPHYVAVRSHQHHVYRLEVRVSSAAAASGLCATLKRHAQACVRVNA